MQKVSTKRVIIEYLKTHKQFTPAFRANSWLTVKGIRFFLGSECGKRCRELSPTNSNKDILLRDWEYKHDRLGTLRAYRTFYLNKKIKRT